MPTILNVHAGGAPVFALKHKEGDSVSSIKSRAVKKLQLEKEDTSAIQALYEWHLVRYALDDEDDYDIFQSRIRDLPEVSIYLTGSSLPQAEKHALPGTKPTPFGNGMVSAIQGRTGSSTSYDSQSLYSSATNSRSPASKATSIHLIASSDAASNDNDNATLAGKSMRSTKSTKTLAERAVAAGVPVHKLAFDEFQNQLGVRTFIGSIGPIENVRMMMKPGHRHCYMAREFALQHGFIPKDAAPGFYGFSGITNLGSWPIRLGSKTVEVQVMLVENSYFPVILGRSFMEKRHVQTNPLDQTHVIFQDVGETIPCDLVVVKDSHGQVVNIS